MTFQFTVKEFIIGNGTPTLQFYRRGFNLQGNGSPVYIKTNGKCSLSIL